MPFSISASVRVSMEEVASSRISTGGSATAARAMASSCRWPWRQVGAVGGHHRVVALGQAADEGVGVGNAWRPARFPPAWHPACQSGCCPRTVPVNRWVSCSTMPRERRRASFADVVAHRCRRRRSGPPVHIVKAVDEVGDGGLARAGGADEGDLLPRLGVEADVLQDGLPGVIAEVRRSESAHRRAGASSAAVLALRQAQRPVPRAQAVRVPPRPPAR